MGVVDVVAGTIGENRIHEVHLHVGSAVECETACIRTRALVVEVPADAR